jgi:hypothetical protein
MHCGLRILYPRLMNLSMGGKILWIIFTEKYNGGKGLS